MNFSSAIASAVLFCSLAASPASAVTSNVTALMTERYFEFDTILTLGALALASGALAAIAIAGSRRRAAVAPEVAPHEGWRDAVMLALEADLAQFALSLPRAA